MPLSLRPQLTAGCSTSAQRIVARLTEEVRTLEADVRQEEYDGVANPLEMVSIIKSLQRTLSSVEAELAKCPETE